MHVEANGIRIHYEMQGSGPWLVLSHSLACSTQMWNEQVNAFSDRFRIVNFDTRGHGKTDAPAGEYSLDMLADDLQGMLDALGIDTCHFMGLSMGGMIGMTHALRHPGRFSSLILCDTTSRFPPAVGPVWEQRVNMARTQGMGALVDSTLERWFTEPTRKSRPDLVQRIGGLISATPVEGYAGCCHAIPKIDITSKLGAIDVPTLVIVGDQDPSTPVEMSRDIQKAIPGAQLGVIPQAAHLSNLEQPEVFNAMLGQFLKDR